MRVILHIGLHKTGTSAIQYVLFQNRHLLREQGFIYEAGDGPSHNGLLHQMKTGNPLAQQRVSAMCDESPRMKVLISSEVLCEHDTDIEQFLSFIHDYHDITVLAYLRRPEDMLLSAHAECVRSAILRRTASALDDERPYDTTYRSLLERWLENERKRMRVILCPYDPPQWRGGSLLLDFFAMIGVDPSGLDLAVPRDRSNNRLSPLQTEMLRVANALPMTKEQHEALVASVSGLPETLFPHTKEELPEALVRELRNNLRPYLATYRRHYREGFDDRFLVGG